MNDFVPYISEHGPSTGRALVFFHGFPGSHIQSAMIEPFAEKYNVRIFSVDRPGYGFSKPFAKADLTEFMRGLERGLDLRGVQKFFVMGVSGGNPSGVTAAGYFGERVLALGSVCGLAPFACRGFSGPQRVGLGLARITNELVLRKILAKALNVMSPERVILYMQGQASPPDRVALKDQAIRAGILDSVIMSRKQGPEGMAFDMKTFSAPWPVDFSKIRCPHLIWHGQQDKVLNFAMAQELHRLVPHSRLKLFPEDGHYSLPIFHAEELLRELVEAV